MNSILVLLFLYGSTHSATALSPTVKHTATPKLVVFDLDYTLWRPELFQLNHPIEPVTPVDNGQRGVRTASYESIDLFPAARKALQQLHRSGIPVAVASRTHLDRVARTLLSEIMVDETESMQDIIGTMPVIIRGSSKESHFYTIQEQTGIQFDAMSFYDNEYGNIVDVERLGVHCVYCPDGMNSEEIFNDGLSDYAFFGKKMGVSRTSTGRRGRGTKKRKIKRRR